MKYFEVKSAKRNNKKYFTIDLTKFNRGLDCYLVIYEFSDELLQNTQYVWKPRTTEEILKNSLSDSQFKNYFEEMKASDVMSETYIMNETRLSDTTKDPFVSNGGDSEPITTKFIKVTDYIGKKSNLGYIGDSSLFYQFDMYVFNMSTENNEIKFKERELYKGVQREILIDKKSESSYIPYFINGEEFNNNKLRYLIENRIENINTVLKNQG